MRGVREFEEKFETLGPLMFGLADGQSEAPKIMAKKVKRKTWIKMVTDYDAQVKDFYWGDEALGEETSESLVNVKH